MSDGLREAVAAIVGAQNVLEDPSDQAPYVTDWRDRYHGKARFVVRPGSAAEVAEVVKLCAAARVPMVPQGGNTGLCGGATPDKSGAAVVFRLDRMNRIREINPTAGTMIVEAGSVLADLQSAADQAGLLFPLSLGAEGSCRIGGNISTNAGGVAVLRYGPTRDLVLGLEVVLADGTIRDWMSPLRKNTTGYDLKQLFIGAEGTLGIITAAALKVFPKPRQTAVAMATLGSVADALELLGLVRSSLGDRLSSFEIMSWTQVDVVLRHIPGTTMPFGERAPWYILIEATDTLADLDLRQALETTLAEALEKKLIRDAVVPSSEAQAAALWRVRHSVSEANKRDGLGVSHDTAVPLDRQAEFARQIEARIGRAFPDAPLLMTGHIGDGNIHVIALLDKERYAEKSRFESAAAEINGIVDEVTLSLHGTISAEHGIGVTNKQRLMAGRGAADVELMRGIKRLLDPLGLMNPGKVFDLELA